MATLTLEKANCDEAIALAHNKGDSPSQSASTLTLNKGDSPMGDLPSKTTATLALNKGN